MDGIWVALIAALGILGSGVFGPWLLARQLNKQRRAEKADDYARQDEVADKAAKLRQEERARQDEVAAQAAEAARLLLASNETVRQAAQTTHKQLVEIHGMVDGNLTAALRAELEAVRQQLLLQRENVKLNGEAGRAGSDVARVAIAALESRVVELSTTLGERLAAVKAAQEAKSTVAQSN